MTTDDDLESVLPAIIGKDSAGMVLIFADEFEMGMASLLFPYCA